MNRDEMALNGFYLACDLMAPENAQVCTFLTDMSLNLLHTASLDWDALSRYPVVQAFREAHDDWRGSILFTRAHVVEVSACTQNHPKYPDLGRDGLLFTRELLSSKFTSLRTEIEHRVRVRQPMEELVYLMTTTREFMPMVRDRGTSAIGLINQAHKHLRLIPVALVESGV